MAIRTPITRARRSPLDLPDLRLRRPFQRPPGTQIVDYVPTPPIPAPRPVPTSLFEPSNRVIYSTPVVQRAPQKAQPTLAQKRVQKLGFFEDFWLQLQKALNNETFVLLVALVVAAVALHVDSTKSGPFHQLISFLEDRKLTALASFLTTHLSKVIGAIIFAPVIYEIPQSKRTIVIVFAGAWILITSAQAPFLYALQALALYLFLKLQKKSHKLVIIIIIGIFIYILIENNKFFTPNLTSPKINNKQ